MLKISDRLVTRSCARLATLSIAALGAGACQKGPLEWRSDVSPVAMPARGDEASAPVDARLVLHPDGSLALEAIGPLPASPAAADTAACAGSLRIAALSPSEIYGVWWSRRTGGRAWLVSSRSDDSGTTWMAPVPVDTTDRGVVSCTRPAPAIAADAASGYVHVTYFLNGPNGPGVFFSHSMERGELFHSPVPIMYGGRPSASAVAAADSVVIVAFEDPNRERSQVQVAVSRTWGHIFLRDRVEASSDETLAEHPLVAVRDSLVAVGWHGSDRAVMARTAAFSTK